jgi:hypothetical protein
MISSSSSIALSLFFVGLKLTGEFTSLEEPAEVSDFVAEAVFLPTDPNLSDLRGELSPETRRGS